MSPLNVIFLDFDGVLVTPASAFARGATGSVADRDAVEALNYLVAETGARLVISSTWRLEYSPGELSELLQSWGIQTSILGITPSGPSRSEEILTWLENYRGSTPIGDFVILDDSPDMGDLASRLIQTDFEIGLRMDHARQARDLLNLTRTKD